MYSRSRPMNQYRCDFLVGIPMGPSLNHIQPRRCRRKPPRETAIAEIEHHDGARRGWPCWNRTFTALAKAHGRGPEHGGAAERSGKYVSRYGGGDVMVPHSLSYRDKQVLFDTTSTTGRASGSQRLLPEVLE
jgi:hypothetical protein